MFSRKFMKQFPVRKYGNPSAPYGTLSTDAYLMGPRDTKPLRISAYFLVTLVIVMAYSNFEVFHEVVHHFSGPIARTIYLDKVPQSVKGPNEEIIENYAKIQQGKRYAKIFFGDEL